MRRQHELVVILALAILALAVPVVWATTYHTITVDGDMSDWAIDEAMEAAGPYTLYLTWNASNLYLGLTGAYLGDTVGQDKSFFACFDTDLTPGSGAPADGYGNVTFNVNLFAPEVCYYFAGGAGWYEWSTWTGSAWSWNGWRNDGTYYNWPGNPAANPGSELTILRSDIGNPAAVAIVAWLTPEQPIPGPVEASWPTPNPAGTTPTLYRFYKFASLGTGISPNSAVPDAAASVQISEIRTDQPGTDNDEYFELAGLAGTSLADLTYLVIGDGTGGSGVIEEVTSLTGQTMPASGFFVAAESTFSLGTADLVTSLNFENSDNVTHLLVSGFTGSDGQDLDTNDDGILDVAPWAQVIDLIALIKEENPPVTTEYHYGPPIVGPDGSSVPGHAYRCATSWFIGQFDPAGGDDTPNGANNCYADLSVEKTGPSSVSPGGYITYTITCENGGNIAAAGAILSDTLPNEVFYVGDDSGLACPACIPGATGTLTWYAGTIAPGGGAAFFLTVQVSDTVPPDTVLTNTVEITASGDVNPANNTDLVTTVVGCLAPTADFSTDSPVLLGEPMHFTSTVVGSAPFTYTWDFGDGQGSSNEPNPTYTYATTGTFTVFLTVENACGLDVVSHEVAVYAQVSVLINEFDAQTPGTDQAEFIELYDGGVGNTALDGLVLVFFNGDAANDASYYAIDLDGYSTDADGYFVAGNAAVPGVDVTFPNNTLQNGQDAIGLFIGDSTDFPNGTPVTNTNLIDAVVYDDYPPGDDDPALLAMLLNPGQPMVLEGDDATDDSAQRCPNGSGGLRNTDTYIPSDPTPDAANNCYTDVAIDKGGPLATAVGGYVTYTISYENVGVIAVLDIVISDTLPNEVFYVGDDSGLACPACIPGATGTLTWYAGIITPGGGATFFLTVQVSDTLPPSTVLTNTVEITAEGDVNPTNNTDLVTTTLVGSDIGVAKSCPPDPLLPGQIITYTLSYETVGEPAQSVVLTDLLPVGVAYLSDSSGVTPTQPTTGTLVWAMGTLTDSGSFVVTALVSTNPMTWTFTNQAWISATNDSLAANNYDACSNQGPRPIPVIQSTTDPGGDGTYPSPYLGQYVYLLGLVTADSNTFGTPNTRYLIRQGSGPWSGLLVYNGGDHPPVSEGDLVLLGGQVAEYSGMTELNIRTQVGGYQQVLSSGNPLIVDPVTTADITPGLSFISEQWEGVLVEVNCARVTSEPDQYGEWGATDASGEEAVIDDWAGYSYTPTLGDELAWIRGILFYNYGRYALEPRADGDLALAPQVVAVSPEPGAEVCADMALAVRFDTEMDPPTVEDAFTLVGPAGPVDVDFGYDPATWTAAFTPTAPLLPGSRYTATLTTTATTPEGIPLCAPATWSFTTASAPEVSFTAPPTACVEAPVQFTGLVDGGLAPFTYLWTFGDGGTASTLSPSHTYIQTGTFDVTLVVTDGCGTQAGYTAPITIEECAAPPTLTYVYLPIVVKND